MRPLHEMLAAVIVSAAWLLIVLMAEWVISAEPTETAIDPEIAAWLVTFGFDSVSSFAAIGQKVASIAHQCGPFVIAGTQRVSGYPSQMLSSSSRPAAFLPTR